jgi:hypothetical protein
MSFVRLRRRNREDEKSPVLTAAHAQNTTNRYTPLLSGVAAGAAPCMQTAANGDVTALDPSIVSIRRYLRPTSRQAVTFPRQPGIRAKDRMSTETMRDVLDDSSRREK